MDNAFVKYNNKRTGKVTTWNPKNADKPEAQFIKDNLHLGYTEDELKEAHGLIISSVKVKKGIETEPKTETLEKQSGEKSIALGFKK